MRKIWFIFILSCLTPLCFAQEEKEEEVMVNVQRTIKKVEPYEFTHLMRQGEKRLGYFLEILQEHKREWRLTRRSLFVKFYKKNNLIRRRFQREENLEILFNRRFRLISYKHETRLANNSKSWEQGKVEDDILVWTNSKGKRREISWSPKTLPLDLMMLHFLTLEDMEKEYKIFEIKSRKLSNWLVSVNNMKIEQRTFNNRLEHIGEDTPLYKTDIIGALAQEFVIEDDEEGRKLLDRKMTYEVATNGKNAAGILLKWHTPKTHNDWVLRYDYLLFEQQLFRRRSKYNREEAMARLRPAIADLLSSDPDTRYRAVRTVGRLRLRISTPALIEMLRDKDEKVRKEAYKFLKSMTKQKYSPSVVTWRRWWSIQKRKEARKRALERQQQEKDS